MEKTIRILSLSFQPTQGYEDKPSKDKWVVETASGNFSIWDDELARKLAKKQNQLVSVDVREAQEGTNYLPTITAMNDASDGTVGVKPEDIIWEKDNSQIATQEAKNYTTTQRIAAAVELKAAVELAGNLIGGDIEIHIIGKLICDLLPEIHAAHKLALSMQDE